MVNVAQQSIKNFLWSNIGVILGALYTFLLIPRAFDENPAQWGMIQLLVYYSQILLPMTLVGIPTVILRYFPSFKKQGLSNSLYSMSLITVSAVVMLVSVIFVILRGYLVSGEGEVENVTGYMLLVVPVLLLSTFFEVFAAWSKVNLKSTVPNFLKDSFIKIWNFLMILLFFFHVINFNTLVILYFVIYPFQAFLLFTYIKKIDTFKFVLNRDVLRNTFRKEHLSYMFFNVMGTAAFTAMNKLDLLMIGKMLSLQEVAFYTIGLALVAFVQIPEKSISAISVPTLSHLMEKQDHSGIHTLYKKTSINQVVISGFIFLGIWINHESIAAYLGPKFGNIAYVILFLGLAKIVDVLSGLNGPLIGISKYYRVGLYMQVGLVLLIVVSNVIFIPRYGINGAAMASFISLSLYNTMKTLFVYNKYRIWPFTYKSLLAIGIGLLALLINRYIPEMDNIFIDILVRTAIFTVVFVSAVLGLRVSEDINILVEDLFTRIQRK